MVGSIRKMLWGAFAALFALVAIGLAVNLTILNSERQQAAAIIGGSEPLLDAVRDMDDGLTTMISACRGYLLTGETQFLQQYDDAVREFDKAARLASQQATDAKDQNLITQYRVLFSDVHSLTDKQIELRKEGKDTTEYQLETARILRGALDYRGIIVARHRQQQAHDQEAQNSMRLSLTLSLVIAGVLIILGAAFAISRIEASMTESIARQVRRTEAMIAGMSDGVMLVDGEGRTVFINPAGQKLIGSQLGVPIFKHADVYGFLGENGETLDARELPAAQALATGLPVRDATMMIVRGDSEVTVSMSATPLHEEASVAGVVVTFRDITERRRLEEELQLQAERAQTLADAGAFFASNIDPIWVTQAIAERVAEVLGDWAAVILKDDQSNDLRVTSIYHRDMASLGLAWSYIYRQPLAVGEGLIGQVVATGFPSLTTNVGGAARGEAFTVAMATSATPMQLASLLILPLRTRREMLGALVIAANDPDRVMTDEKLPLAEVLAERAALAIENSKLYTEQVEARRKVEDLSRLKDEFLSIASHELRTPVTSIKGYTQLAKTLIRENNLTTSEENLDIALDQIDRMSRLILELLDVSRIETGRLEIHREAIAWATFVRDIVHRHHTAVSDRRFHLNVPSEMKLVSGDRDRLEQVLGNLLENAVKYSPEGSEIFVGVEDRGEQMVTSVCDRGIGIPIDEIAQVFERFHRGRQVSSTNYGGLGLGLYITKQIIDRHGGTIWVESKEGSGTTFYFTLPTEAVAAEAAQAQPVARS
jgi:signal transduction histidine kinase/CHASE3 domain sensor protein